MKIFPLLSICFLILISNSSSAGQALEVKPEAELISSQELKGFEKCRYSKNLSKSLDRFNESVRPVREEESSLIFAVRSEFFGLPVTAFEMGICEDGSRDCGWSVFLGLIIPMPLNEARAKLKQKTGIDFTKAKRVPESHGGYTLRPLLSTKVGKKNESILFCDPGNI